jgi:hypothetical protein
MTATNSGGHSQSFVRFFTEYVSDLPFGNIDSAVSNVVKDGSAVVVGDSVLVSGWVSDAVDGSPLSNVKIYLDTTSSFLGTPTLGVTRSDVQNYFGNPAFANSGFQFNFPTSSSMYLGYHNVVVVATTLAGT